MKRICRDTNPDHKAPAKLYKDGKFIAEVPCQIWFPRHSDERPFLCFESIDKTHQAIGSISPNYDVFIEIVGLDQRKVNVYARRMFVENFCTYYRSPELPPLITFEGEPEAVTEVVKMGDRDKSHGKSHIVLHLTNNFLMSPNKIVEKSFTGAVKVKDVRTHKDLIKPLGKVTFNKHFYYIALRDGGEASYAKLVAVFETGLQVRDLNSFEELIRPAIDDYLLLASLASNQRTSVVAWTSNDGESLFRGWYGNVTVAAPNSEKRHGHDDVLIDLVDFRKFMHTATGTFSRFSTGEKQLVRRAIYGVLPRQGRTVESSILSFFPQLNLLFFSIGEREI